MTTDSLDTSAGLGNGAGIGIGMGANGMGADGSNGLNGLNGSKSEREREIVIIGGGIIGSTSAYFLTRHPVYDPSRHRVTLLEASGIASGASGKAGGLVARWGMFDLSGLNPSLLGIVEESCCLSVDTDSATAYPSAIVPLSFRLHAELAAEHGGAKRWGYRGVRACQVDALVKGNGGRVDGEHVSLEKTKGMHDEEWSEREYLPKDLDWLERRCVTGYSDMAGEGDTAQVHPYQFTTAMAELAREKGVEVVLGKATRIEQRNGRVTGVTYADAQGDKTIAATDVVIAAGPWTKDLLPAAPISPLRAHSVTIRPSKPISAFAVFTEIEMHGASVSPEIYARPNNEAYACGEGDTQVELPAFSKDVQVDQKRCQDVIDHVSAISQELRDGEVLVRQACYLPNVEGSVRGPFIGPTGVGGLFMAAGHTCWGIQNGPATGKLISEFIFDGKATSAKIKSLDPRQVL